MHKPASRQAWASKQTGPLSRRLLHQAALASHTRACTSVPRLILKYALQARHARLSLQLPVLHQSSLPCRCLIPYCLFFCHSRRLLSALSSSYSCGTSSSLSFRFEPQIVISCMHAPVRPEVTYIASQVHQLSSANARQRNSILYYLIRLPAPDSYSKLSTLHTQPFPKHEPAADGP